MIWVKVIFVIFFDAITTVRVLTATNNDLKLDQTLFVHLHD